jgi:uncharacterized damage-inducible protein DinB
MTEAWLRGPVEGVPPSLMPVAHSLIDALEEIETVADLDAERLWMRPAGAASVGFHLRHIPGALDRLLTYAQGSQLDNEQLAFLRSEADPGDPPQEAPTLIVAVREGVDAALDQLRATHPESLLEPREVGRRRIPSTVQGLLFHAAEHTRRHAGQVIVTARVVREVSSAASPSLTIDALRAALEAWEDAGLRGLCGDGRLDVALDVLRARGVSFSRTAASPSRPR